MKVVLFCGGLGMRLRDNPDDMPKPMIKIGYRPILWHVMRYYAHFGHKDFVLCLGYRGDVIKEFFLNYDECVSNDFVLSGGGKKLELVSSDIDGWNITFVDTGVQSNIGQRLKAVEHYLEGETEFLANYSDGLTDLPLTDHIAHFRKHGKIASFLCVPPNLSYHFVELSNEGHIETIRDVSESGLRINGGYFIFKSEIFDHLRDNEELVREPFQRLLRADQLIAYRYDGSWLAMDTFKDKQRLEQLWANGPAPWEVWRSEPEARPHSPHGTAEGRGPERHVKVVI